MNLEVHRGSVIEAPVDAIVNAANSRLAHAGGLARAIAEAAGPELEKESAEIEEVPTGSAAATTGGRLHARWVIHAVGPVWSGGGADEAELLASAYRSAVEVAVTIGARSIAFPSLATGIFGYPLDLAAPIAVAAVSDAWAEHTDAIDAIGFHVFTDDEFAAFSDAASRRDLDVEDLS